MDTDEHRFLAAMKTKMAIAFVAILGWQIGAQTVTDTPPTSTAALAQGKTTSDKTDHKIPPQDTAWLKSQGWTDEQIANAIPIQNIGETQDTYNQLTNYYHIRVNLCSSVVKNFLK